MKISINNTEKLFNFMPLNRNSTMTLVFCGYLDHDFGLYIFHCWA